MLFRININIQVMVLDLRSSVHIDNEIKEILIFGQGLKDSLNDNTLNSEKRHSILLSNRRNFV